MEERDGLLVSTAEIEPGVDAETVVDDVRADSSRMIADTDHNMDE